MQTDIRPILEEAARSGGLLTYQELAQRAGFPPPHTIHKTTTALEALMAEDHAAGRPLLAALVVSKATGVPAPGFFGCLTTLGRYFGDDRGAQAERHWRRELEAVQTAYGVG